MRAFGSRLLATAVLITTSSASIIPPLARSLDDLQTLEKRCNNPCGSGGWLCCPDGTTCYIDPNDQAQCADNGVQFITSTYVLTNLETVTTTIAISQATGPSCRYSIGETSCGGSCCTADQYCLTSNGVSTCQESGSGSSEYHNSGLFTVTTVITNTADQPYRPTSNTLVTVTATGTAGELITTTQGFLAPTGTIIAEQGGGGGGLSAGAIAGIVIGVLAFLIILILILLCCCAKGILDTLLGIFGLGSRKRKTKEEVEIYESRHHGSRRGRSASAVGKRTWFGTKPKRSSVVDEKKSGGIGRATGVAAFLGGLAIILGLKRRKDRKDNKSNVSYGSSYYSDYTSSEYLLPIFTKGSD